ncbi:hypothetical protein WMY93_004775 [Mugilogobius chulae]|uniref:Thyroxine-binding globulin n=1 Tax=Mugilogobius chulae TaxID=88201 RepID=A0AAW0PPY4_9GOBI
MDVPCFPACVSVTGSADRHRRRTREFDGHYAASVFVFCLAAAVVTGRPQDGHGHSMNDASDQDTAQDNSVSLVKTANKDVSVALGALSVGARGDTHKQLFTGLGFNSSLLNQDQVNQAFGQILGKNGSEDLTQGTAVFVDNKFKPTPEFLDTLKQSYFTDGFTVDFTKTTDNKTSGKIDKMVEDLDEELHVSLSYIYFKGKWKKPFDPQSTQEDSFQVDENTKVPVQMMNKEDGFEVYYDQAINTSVLHLPFNSSCSMLLMLPAKMETLEKNISPRSVEWMGMTDMFGDRADLSGIAEGQKIAVSEVVHKAALDVDEEGATAAAATGVTITLLSSVTSQS